MLAVVRVLIDGRVGGFGSRGRVSYSTIMARTNINSNLGHNL